MNPASPPSSLCADQKPAPPAPVRDLLPVVLMQTSPALPTPKRLAWKYRWALLGAGGVAAGVVLALVLFFGGEQEKKEEQRSNADKILGTWDMVRLKSKVLPAGAKATVEFTKEGKVKMIATARGKTTRKENSYKVNGDKLTITMKKPDAKEETSTDTIWTLDDTKLVIEDEEGKIAEFKRKN